MRDPVPMAARWPRELPRAAGVAGCILLVATGTATALDGASSGDKGARPVVRLSGEQGLRPFRLGPGARPGTVIDARAAIFTLANSRNPAPSAARPCGAGNLPTNPYPISLRTARVAIVGPLVRGSVPQASDWSASYCNSAAIDFKQAPGGLVDGARITRSWDAIRATGDSAGLTVRNAWISEVRDDAIENDYLHSATIADTLIDGAFQGISIKPAGERAIDGRGNLVTLSGVLIRLAEYPYKGEMRFGALTKNGAASPRLAIRDSVVAIDASGASSFPAYWSRTWSSLAQSSNNALLWLSDAPIPASFPRPPASFQIITGAAARETWRRARANWIDCHPMARRDRGDPPSQPRSCRRGAWGG